MSALDDTTTGNMGTPTPPAGGMPTPEPTKPETGDNSGNTGTPTI